MLYENNYTHHNQAELIRGGSNYFEKLTKLFEEATKEIHLQTYILNEDSTGTFIITSLKKAALRGVQIYIIADGVASQNLSNKFVESIKKSGINFRFFEPIFKNKHYYLGRRMHHKIVTVDNNTALVGGMNIADRYNDLPDQKAWLDFAVIVKGEIVPQITQYCHKIWEGTQYQKRNFNNDEILFNAEMNINDTCDVRMRINDWMWHKNEISNSYIEMLRHSKKEVLILCSYFIPGKVMRRQIFNAAKRGVRIIVVTAGKSDVWIVKKAEKWWYDWLLRNKIELYEYKKTILHGKIAVCDDSFVTIGSYNINNLSTYASIEFNVDIKNEALAKKAHASIKNIIENDCSRITKQNHADSNNILKQFSRWLSYQFIRFVLKIVTISFKQHHQ